MKQYLNFLRDFRPVKGYDGEVPNFVDVVLSDVHDKPGVYIITSDTTRFVYPKGTSKVIYIGKADDIRRRLKEHQCLLCSAFNDPYDEIWHSDKYKYMQYHGANVIYYLCLGNQNAKDLESDIIRKFYLKYGAMPVGNGARSFHKEEY